MTAPRPGRRHLKHEKIELPDKPALMEEFERRHLMLELRKAGWGYHHIALAFEISEKEARKKIRLELRRAARILHKSAREVFQLEYERLEDLTLALWPQAQAGSIRAVETLIRLMERRAKMLGMDAPLRTEARLDMTLEAVTPEQLQQKAQELGLYLQPPNPQLLNYTLPGLEEDLPQEQSLDAFPASSSSAPGNPDPPAWGDASLDQPDNRAVQLPEAVPLPSDAALDSSGCSPLAPQPAPDPEA